MKGLLVLHVVGIGKLVYINLVTYLHLKTNDAGANVFIINKSKRGILHITLARGGINAGTCYNIPIKKNNKDIVFVFLIL